MHGGFWRCVRPLQPCFARSTAERMPLLRHVASALRPLHVGHKQPPPKTARCMAASRPARVARAEHCADAVLLLAALHARDQLPAAPGSRAARASLPYACSSALPGAGRGRAGAPVQRADEVLLQAALHAHDQEVHDRLGHRVLQARAHEPKVALHQQPRHLHLHLLLLRRADRHAQRLRARACAPARARPARIHGVAHTGTRSVCTAAPALPLAPARHACTADAHRWSGSRSPATDLLGQLLCCACQLAPPTRVAQGRTKQQHGNAMHSTAGLAHDTTRCKSRAGSCGPRRARGAPRARRTGTGRTFGGCASAAPLCALSRKLPPNQWLNQELPPTLPPPPPPPPVAAAAAAACGSGASRGDVAPDLAPLDPAAPTPAPRASSKSSGANSSGSTPFSGCARTETRRLCRPRGCDLGRAG